MRVSKKASGRFFEKKLRKKLLLLVHVASPTPMPPGQKVFCGAFLQKSDLFLYPFFSIWTSANYKTGGSS
jgi:hypothetical protein